ncbi:hypothetical protein ACFQX9_22580 [Bradyrhizobium sp. GCM10028915]|uniref:hypothetical protein n=1 Tax=Bradyrhizobium sp. GCM10028915 TaxID=3273385 RepID=UPI00362173D2
MCGVVRRSTFSSGAGQPRYPAGYDDVPGFPILQPRVETAYCFQRRIAGNAAVITGAQGVARIGLEFLENTGGESEGLSDPGVENFRDKPFTAVARETGQNSRDARLDHTGPVRLTFDVLSIKSDDFPSIAAFREAARLCLKKADRPKNEKEKGFFQQAVRALEAPETRILRISDFNTTGVRGPCEEGYPFHALAKSDSVSAKEDVSSGGSFGIGKNAALAVSDIQTAFISTRYKDDQGVEHVLCMGKTLFISHTDAAGKPRRRKGYWGKIDGYLPLDNPAEIPGWLLRDTQGTSIFSICMRDDDADWRYEMAAAIIINFFAAIERREMEFEIDNGAIKINRNTLQALFQNPKVLEAVKLTNAGVAFDTARTLHGCLIDEKTTLTMLDVQGLGKVQMRVLLRDGLGYTIGIIRNGMYITDNLAKFNEPFKRFPLHREFAVVIEPDGKPEGEWFKRLENPAHDDLSADRITDPQLRAQGKRAFERLAKQIRQRIRELAKTEPSSSMELDELNDFFASDATREWDDAGPETDPRVLKPTAIQKSPPRPRRAASPSSEDDDPPIPGPGPLPPEPAPGPEPGPGPGPGPGPKPPRPQPRARSIELQGERNLLLDGTAGRKRRIFFTSPVAGLVSVQVEATGLSNPDQLAVTAVSGGTLISGKIEVACKRGERVGLDIEFDSPYTGPIELDAVVAPVAEETPS